MGVGEARRTGAVRVEPIDHGWAVWIGRLVHTVTTNQREATAAGRDLAGQLDVHLVVMNRRGQVRECIPARRAAAAR